MSYKPPVGISPNLQLRCSGYNDELIRLWGERSKVKGQGHSDNARPHMFITLACFTCLRNQWTYFNETYHSYRCFAVSGPTLWNSLPLSVRDPSLTLTQFCLRLKTVLFCRAYETLP